MKFSKRLLIIFLTLFSVYIATLYPTSGIPQKIPLRVTSNEGKLGFVLKNRLSGIFSLTIQRLSQAILTIFNFHPTTNAGWSWARRWYEKFHFWVRRPQHPQHLQPVFEPTGGWRNIWWLPIAKSLWKPILEVYCYSPARTILVSKGLVLAPLRFSNTFLVLSLITVT